MPSARAIARRLGVSEVTIRRAIQKGALPAQMLNGSWDVTNEDAAAWAARRAVPETAPYRPVSVPAPSDADAPPSRAQQARQPSQDATLRTQTQGTRRVVVELAGLDRLIERLVELERENATLRARLPDALPPATRAPWWRRLWGR